MGSGKPVFIDRNNLACLYRDFGVRKPRQLAGPPLPLLVPDLTSRLARQSRAEVLAENVTAVFVWCCVLDLQGNGATWVHGLPVCGPHARGRLPHPRAVAPSGVRPDIYIENGLVQVKHGLSTTARPKGGMGPGREERKSLLERASRIAPCIRYRGAK